MTRHAVFTLLLLTGLDVYADGHVTVNNAWIADAPDSAATRSAYFEIENRGNTTISLTAVTSPVFTKTEMHKSITENGMARMQHLTSVAIEPGRRLVFRPADYHLMLYNAGRTLQPGEHVPLRFAFSDATVLEVHAEVRKLSGVHQHQTEETGSSMITAIKAYYQYLLPQHWLSGLMHHVTRIRWQPLKHLMISSFIRIYDVDMSIAAEPDPSKYSHFNDFFTRALNPSARPIDNAPNAVVSPVDGVISQVGIISGDKLIQAKGKEYSLQALLGGDQDLASTFSGGHFITMYLSPRDYHRIHMPLTGTLKIMTYVPGDLFSVSPATTDAIDNLFARNERVIQIFDTEVGEMALIMVGAIFVGSMETVWAGPVTPPTERKHSVIRYMGNGSTVRLHKGEEMGRFNMGSTVILLFEKDSIRWDEATLPTGPVVLGRRIGEIVRTE